MNYFGIPGHTQSMIAYIQDFDRIFLEIPVKNFIFGMLLTCPIGGISLLNQESRQWDISDIIIQVCLIRAIQKEKSNLMDRETKTQLLEMQSANSNSHRSQTKTT